MFLVSKVHLLDIESDARDELSTQILIEIESTFRYLLVQFKPHFPLSLDLGLMDSFNELFDLPVAHVYDKIVSDHGPLFLLFTTETHAVN